MLATAGPLERDERDVVLLVPAPADELVELLEQVVEQLAARRARAAMSAAQAREAEHVAGGPVGLDQAVAVEQDALAGLDDGLLLLVGHAGQQPERHAGGPQLEDAVAVRTYGQVWPALAYTTRPVAGSRTRYRQVTNMRAGISGSEDLVGARAAPPRARRGGGASPRRTDCVRAMIKAAGTPLSVTSPTTMPIRPSGNSMKS